MKIPSVTRETTTPAATIPPPASPPDDAAPAPRPVVALPGEDGETVSMVAPPPELLARLQAEAAAQTADELARQLAAAARPTGADASWAADSDAADSASPDAGTPAAIPAAPAASSGTAAANPSPALPPTVDERQPFKVVVRLKPITGNRWHATIGIGRDGCDPCWAGSDIDDWPEALDSVLEVHAAAAARWAEQPRNPRPAVTPIAPGSVAATGAPSSPSAKTDDNAGKAKAAAKSNAAPPPTTPAAASAPPPVPAADPAPAGGVEKLTLF